MRKRSRRSPGWYSRTSTPDRTQRFSRATCLNVAVSLEIAAERPPYCGLGWLATKGAEVDGWLLGQVSTVLTALSHAQELFDGAGRPALPVDFAPRPDLQDNLGGGLF